jgi:ATP-dependent exoDNAse (exonuclease V) alpha subunit
MAIFHLNAKIISRNKGQSAIAAAAYRSGERLRDEQTGEQKTYQARAQRIEHTQILAPENAPEWVFDRNQLWNGAEKAEKRKDAQLAREIEVSLPHELTPKQREWLVKDFAREAFVRKGYVVDIAIHAPDKAADERNHHAHLMVSMRTIGPGGFASKKDRELNSREQLHAWRKQWASLANRHLERHGHEARIDHRSLEAQGVDREATLHLGYAAAEMAARGAQSDRASELKDLLARNDIRLEMKALDGELAELEKQRRSSGEPGLDWTDRGGMVAQQKSAIEAFRRLSDNTVKPSAAPDATAGDRFAESPDDRRARLIKAFKKKAGEDPDSPTQGNDRPDDRGGRSR